MKRPCRWRWCWLQRTKFYRCFYIHKKSNFNVDYLRIEKKFEKPRWEQPCGFVCPIPEDYVALIFDKNIQIVLYSSSIAGDFKIVDDFSYFIEVVQDIFWWPAFDGKFLYHQPLADDSRGQQAIMMGGVWWAHLWRLQYMCNMHLLPSNEPKLLSIIEVKNNLLGIPGDADKFNECIESGYLYLLNN